MRRIVGISARSAVAVALPLAGAIYLAAEDRRITVDTADGPQVVRLRDAKSRDESEDRAIGPSDHRTIEPRAIQPSSINSAASSAPAANVEQQSQDEVAAEQQAAQIPVQESARDSASDAHIRKIVISIPDRQLALLEDGQLVKVYPVAVGKNETPSPEGEFTIINHAVNPMYRHDGKVIGPGRTNPLGTRWMGLSAKGYGIHGTNAQGSVGKVASHGCFRMKKKDVEELYTLVQVGDAVSVHGERNELTASLFTVDAGAGNKGAEVASASPVSTTAGSEQ